MRIDAVTGAQTLIASGSPLGNPLGIGVEPDGNLIVADNVPVGSGAVYRVTLSGSVSLLATGGDFRAVSGIAVGPDGRIYVSDYEAFGDGGAVFSIDPRSGARHVVSRGASV